MERQLQCYVLSATAAAALLVFVAGCESLNNAAMDATAEVAEASVSRAQVVAELRAGTAPWPDHRGRRQRPHADCRAGAAYRRGRCPGGRPRNGRQQVVALTNALRNRPTAGCRVGRFLFRAMMRGQVEAGHGASVAPIARMR